MLRAAGLICVIGVSLAAGGEPEPPARDPRIVALVADAQAIPSEFASEALLRIAGSGLVRDKDWRREMIEAAYMRAYAAQEPYRRTSAGIPADSRQGAATIASESTLNRVSLQVRATQLLAFDFPERARELFEWIELNPEPATCEDPLVPALDEYFNALTGLARTTFDRERRSDAVQFFELYLWRAHLPTDMPSVARSIVRFHPDEGEATHLETVFRSILDRGLSDPRGFSTATLDIVLRAGELQHADRDRGVPGWYVMEALRAYLVAQLSGPRCGDSVTESLTPSAFNDTLRSLDPFADVKPIDAADNRPRRILGVARVDSYWRTGEARRLHDTLTDLRGPNRAPRSLKERQTDAWRHRAERFVVDIDHWNGGSEASERDAFYQKAVLFTGIIDMMPRCPERTTAIGTFVDFLRHADVERVRRNLWFVFVSRLASSRGDMRSEALAALERSAHPILSLYGRIERSTGRGRER